MCKYCKVDSKVRAISNTLLRLHELTDQMKIMKDDNSVLKLEINNAKAHIEYEQDEHKQTKVNYDQQVMTMQNKLQEHQTLIKNLQYAQADNEETITDLKQRIVNKDQAHQQRVAEFNAKIELQQQKIHEKCNDIRKLYKRIKDFEAEIKKMQEEAQA